MIDWNRLISNKELDYIETMILECIYSNNIKSLSSIELYKKFKMIQISKPTLIRKLNKLERIGLIILIKSKPIFADGINGLQDNVMKLVEIKKKRMELVSKYFKLNFIQVIL